MSELRKQLQSARDSHNKLHYPGDLAADVLAPRITWQQQFRIGISVAMGIAAVLLLIIWLSHSSLMAPPQSMVMAPASQPADESQPWLAFTIEPPSENLSNVQYSPSGADTFSPSTIPAVWGFPTPTSIQQELSTSTPTQEESS
jgi:hypothetical protein